MFDVTSLHADINSGHAFEVWGVIGDLWFWVSKLPYETEWRGFFRENRQNALEFNVKGEDVVQAVNSGFELYEKVKTVIAQPKPQAPRFRYDYYDADCPYCLRGRLHDQAKHEAALQRVYEASR